MRLTVNGIEIPDAKKGLHVKIDVDCQGEEMGPVLIEVFDGLLTIDAAPHSITISGVNEGGIALGDQFTDLIVSDPFIVKSEP